MSQACIPVPSQLNLPMWKSILTDSPDDTEIMDMLTYGFPLGYLGPVSDSIQFSNHYSARKFPVQVNEFINKELASMVLYGPYTDPPFIEWTHISPLMTREKTQPELRRIITDLTFKDELSINSYIQKNTSLGTYHHHTLPTVDTFLDDFRDHGTGCYMFTFDVKRAYNNFRTCPLDSPLLAIRWDSKYYLDTTLPFGSRVSSAHV